MKRLRRRKFLTLLAAAVGTGGIGGTLGVAFGRERHRGQAIGTAEPQPTTPGGPAARWSDPATWPTGVPGASTVAVVGKPVLLDVDAHVAGVVIEGAGQLVFDPAASRTLESTGNVVVRGRLTVRPGSAAQRHQLTFQGVDEARFAGGGMDGRADQRRGPVGGGRRRAGPPGHAAPSGGTARRTPVRPGRPPTTSSTSAASPRRSSTTRRSAATR